MPLLPKEIEIQPEEIFDLPDALPWRVAHVRSRQEKVLARHLLRHSIPFYAPQIERKRRRNGRVLVSHLPLFPGYVFFRTARPAIGLVWQSEVAVKLIDVDDQALLNDELRQIRRLQKTGASLTPHLEPVAGDVVRISEGVFQGYTGIVTREKGSERLIVRLTLLRQAVTVDLPRAAIVKSLS
jgi:transcription antitermination factor NusG